MGALALIRHEHSEKFMLDLYCYWDYDLLLTLGLGLRINPTGFRVGGLGLGLIFMVML